MTKDEGISFDRLVGIGNCKKPQANDYNKIISVFSKMNKLGEYTKLTYSSGIKVEDNHLNKVREIA